LTANTVISIDSTLYACVSMPNDIPKEDRMLEVCLHEMCHYWVKKNNIHLSYNNSHIDTKWARIYLILELSALQNALLSTDEQIEQAIIEALTFRKQRHSLFPEQVEEENRFEFDEGLPEFVSYSLFHQHKDSLKKRLSSIIEGQINQRPFYRNFGYTTGAVYAYFISDFGTYRTRLFQNLNIVATMMQSRNIKNIPDTVSALCKNKYNFEQVKHNEDSIEQQQQHLLDSIRYQLTYGAKIIIENKKDKGIEIGFNPNEMFAIDTLGTYFSLLHVSGDFGFLKTENGAVTQSESILIFIDKNTVMRKKIIKKTFDISLKKGWCMKKKGNSYYIGKKK
jgi:hypothetical protein